ncbi:MAG TPA: exodeoxyribonuclease V subunit alpha [Rubrivivax sp.]|nr:exodeoxyribonuclease V subunit alpha [Rubrivivax sp.]HPO18167.1 exodeoxyribonuclease V subunit alpha [Rubrivivax sp.]
MTTAAPGGDELRTALADGFALQVERWARASGAPGDAARLAGRAARALSLAIGDGHVCVPLHELGELSELSELGEPRGPNGAALRTALLASGVAGSVQAPGTHPLILDDAGRLYLHRHFDAERRLAARLVRAAAAPPQPLGEATVQRLRALFRSDGGAHGPEPEPKTETEPDWQMIAAALALRRRLLLISGGPGTGKTSTIVKLLACLLEQQPDARIALAAPTGKAAARMAQALRERAAQLPPGLRERLPTQASTVHRLLGARPGGFGHDAARPLPLDALVVDEASMLDLALATRLLEALPDGARLILLGDKDQLAAVESGAVFAELSADASLSPACTADLAGLCALPAAAVAAAAPTPPPQAGPLRDSVVWLQRSFRFGADSAIARAAAHVRDGRGSALLAQLREAGGDGALHWLDEPGSALAPRLLRCLHQGYAEYGRVLREQPRDVAAIWQAFERFRVLCALREGPRGVLAINRLLGDALRSAAAAGGSSPWFAGRPVMVLRNDPLRGLFNGDIGITLPDADGAPQVHFATPQGFRALPAARLPVHETAFAMTVHKAQGSEFDTVLVLLPAQRSRVLTRELLYTALTRARQRVWLAADAAVLAAATAQPTLRRSGLLARLREQAAAEGGDG